MIARRGSAREVRAAIARSQLGGRTDAQLGEVVLRPHQRDAVERLRAVFRDARGALLADDVGLGKTYTALAAACHAERLLIIAPAALRTMWQGALQRTGVTAIIRSFESLSRGRFTGALPDFVIVDEAHHARTLTTRRYREIATLCADATVLLLTATPVHNRATELRTQLSLFLGGRAWAAPEHELTRYIVKRDASGLAAIGTPVTIPEVDGIHWIDAGDDEALLDEILTLPPCVPPADGGDGGALLTMALVRQWASSRAALHVALRRRLARADALSSALTCGRYPTNAQLRAWQFVDGTLQLAFPEIVSDPALMNPDGLSRAIESHRMAVAALLTRSATEVDPDDHRAAALREIRLRHRDAHCIVFAEYAATVEALYARLVQDGGVAMLTNRGGLVAGGRISRRELLAQFAPDAERTQITEARRVTMLIATDVLSEGVNLQRASVVVHADLPWSPARFEQRVGRARRMDAQHRRVSVYALKPPADTERLVRIESRLREKIAEASRALGVSGTILPRLFHDLLAPQGHATEDDTRLCHALTSWHDPTVAIDGSTPVVAAVYSRCAGLLAAVEIRGRSILIADLGAGLSPAPDVAAKAVECASGNDAPLSEDQLANALSRVHQWIDGESTSGAVDRASNALAQARRQLLRRIDEIATRGPRHLRAAQMPLMRHARRAATAIFGAGAEGGIAELAQSTLPDEAWLRAVCAYITRRARDNLTVQDRSAVIALCILRAPDRNAASDLAASAYAAAAPPP